MENEMSSFEDRERAFENKFTHEEELNFKAAARRDTLLGHWAADLLSMDGAEVDAYARSVFEVDMERKGPESVRDKVYEDLSKASVETSPYLVEKKMTELFEEALRELKAG